MRIASFLLALCAVLCTIATEPRAAQISCKEEWGHAASVGWAKTGFPENIGIPGPTEAHCFAIRIEGEITSGDYNAFRLMLKRHEPYAHTVFLISPGGDVKEAMKIGKLIRDRMLSTETFFRRLQRRTLFVCVSLLLHLGRRR